MIKPDWDIFKVKFSGSAQDNFEWFCYLLFCREVKKDKGIFRYKNQSAIETEPVKKNGEVIGWQAKFYDVSLSSKKGELIDHIQRVKDDYPEITKLIFYLNKDWGQTNKGKAPRGLIEVEEKARKLGIKLDWRMASFFESEFVAIENEDISKHFFRLDNSIFDIIKEQQKHSENILYEIGTSTKFRNQNIEIDREYILNELENLSENIVILSGVGGTGKTAIIKKFFEKYKNEKPFYIFKAKEFEIKHLDELIYNFNINEFVNAHVEDENKIIVIDSAEKLYDLKNTDPFKEFLRILIKAKWKVIFTTRTEYLEVLNTIFAEIHGIAPLNLKVEKLSLTELSAISEKYCFNLPDDEKLKELIRIPFYLNEYLKFYIKDKEVDYFGFKTLLWDKIIKKDKPARERCFFKVALERANEGIFFVNPKCEAGILDNELRMDGILGHKSPHGYYITHDIYEEWALEKIIEIEFLKRESSRDFFGQIGQSLPIRRSFRNWVSEKLLIENDSIKDFIVDVITDQQVEPFWKDEIVISLLLSDYSEYFFEVCKEFILKDNQVFLKRLTFLIRIACKEVDSDIFKNIGLKKSITLFDLKYLLAKPRGKGWKSLIKFVFDNLENIGINKIYFILPVIYDWNSKFKEGETTRYASLIALKYYQWVIQENVYISRGDTQDHLLATICQGAAEIKNELGLVLDEIAKNKWKHPRDPYYDLAQFILSELAGLPVSSTLPSHVLRLADLFWYVAEPEKRKYRYSGAGVESYFNIEDDHTKYYPSSSYQTPIYWLLQQSLKETIDFIVDFTNKAVENYALSDLHKNEIEKVELFIEDDKSIKQYISNRIWCIYRGTQDAPHILESMHMALEKFFLERGEGTSSEALESWLLYLLRKSRSASISALVASIVSAFHNKTFNVAKVLFKTKEFFLYDTNRLILDQNHKNSIEMLRQSFGTNYRNKIYEDERLKACDEGHRKFSLEHLLLNYLTFRWEGISEEEAEERREIIYGILDKYYQEIPEESKQTEADKTWRLCLARMDRRKMNLTFEKTDAGHVIYFNPEIDPELRTHSEQSIQRSSEPMKYASLKFWAELKMRNDDKFKNYEKYENDPKLAFNEIKELVSKLDQEISDSLEGKNLDAEKFIFFNATIPAVVCSALLKYYFDILNEEGQIFCKDIVLDAASKPLRSEYRYQMGDGVLEAISVLPIIFEKFPEERERIKITLLFSLFEEFTVDMWGGTSFSAFPIGAIHNLWENYFDDAQSLLFGYLSLKPKYEKFYNKIREEKYKKGIYGRLSDKESDQFVVENEKLIGDIVENNIKFGRLIGIEKLDLRELKTAFLLIPNKTDNVEHKKIVKTIITAFAKALLSRDRDEKVDYWIRHAFLEKLSYFILSCPAKEIEEYLEPFLEGFNGSEAIADLFNEIIKAEDTLNSYDNFWNIWGLFKDKVIKLCEEGEHIWYADQILKSYLFARVPWREDVFEWHTFNEANKLFFKEISHKVGHCPSTLHSISKLLNDIGSSYLNDGISWVSDMLENNPELKNEELKSDTIYYMENLSRKYVYNNRENIRKSRKLKKEVLIILDFLIEKGSVVGYMLRENIL